MLNKGMKGKVFEQEEEKVDMKFDEDKNMRKVSFVAPSMAKEKDDSAAGADGENQKESLGVRDNQKQGGKGSVVLVI